MAHAKQTDMWGHPGIAENLHEVDRPPRGLQMAPISHRVFILMSRLRCQRINITSHILWELQRHDANQGTEQTDKLWGTQTLQRISSD